MFLRNFLFISATCFVSSTAFAAPEPSQWTVFQPDKKFSIPAADPSGSGIYPIHEPTQCEAALLTNGELAFQARYHFGYKATRSIRAQALLFKADATGIQLAKMFKQKASEGVRVQVIVDSVSNLFDWGTQWMYYDLREHGVEIIGYEPGWLQLFEEINPHKLEEIDMRYHDKIFVVDGELYRDSENAVGIGGGMNMEDNYSRIGTVGAHRWRDQDIITRGNAVKDMMDTFDWNWSYLTSHKRLNSSFFHTDRRWTGWRLVLRKMWHFVTGRVRTNSATYLKRKEVAWLVKNSENLSINFKNVRGRWLQSKPRFGEKYIHEAIVNVLNDAKTEAWLLNAYFVPDAELVEAIKRAARRGVMVRIITNSPKTNDLGIMTDVSRATFKEVLEVNVELGREMVEVYEWYGDFRNGTLHAKVGVVDRKVGWVSSYNLDNRSYELNSETAFFFESNEMAEELTDQIRFKDLKKTRKVAWDDALEYHMPSKIPLWIKLNLARLLRREL